MSFVPRYRQRETPTLTGMGPLYGTIWDTTRDGLLVSEGHSRRPNGSWSGGGPFYVEKVQSSHGAGRYLDWAFFGPHAWKGLSRGVIPGASFRLATLSPPVPWSTQKERLLVPYATGYARTRPGRPLAGLGQFLIELRDLPVTPGKALYRSGMWRQIPLSGLGSYLRAMVAQFRALGPEYLNVVFGWQPFVKDLKEVYSLWQRIDKEMATLIRNNGKGIRRKRVLTNEDSSTLAEAVYPYPFANVFGAPPTWTTGTSLVRSTTRTQKKVWYSACYTYWIPDVTSSAWTLRARLALFGAFPTPELIWEVMPWSWLIDWFGNAGDVIANISPTAVDYVCRYSFIMEHVRTTVTHTCDTSWDTKIIPMFDINIPGGNHRFASITKTETKLRSGGGNPFGLGVTLASLTSRQLAILAALGLSRSSVR